jgi:hypothetical protein
MSAGAVALQGASLPTANTPTYQFGSDGTNLTPGVTLFDANGVGIGPANPLRSLPAGWSVYNTAANTVGFAVSATAGVFHGVTINTGGTTSTATFYDGTSTAGTKLATVATTAIGSLTYDAKLAIGLFIVLAGAGAADVTITYA